MIKTRWFTTSLHTRNAYRLTLGTLDKLVIGLRFNGRAASFPVTHPFANTSGTSDGPCQTTTFRHDAGGVHCIPHQFHTLHGVVAGQKEPPESTQSRPAIIPDTVARTTCFISQRSVDEKYASGCA